MRRLRAVFSSGRIAPALAAVAGPARLAERPPAATREAGAEAPRRREGAIAWIVLALIVAAGLYLRFLHNGYGLPYVYNYDEANHFTNHAAGMFGAGLNPGYFQNPSGYTYLVLGALHVVYGVLGFPLADGTVLRQFTLDPTPIYELARGVSALLAMAGVVATFLVARRFFGARAALVAAAVLTFAFLPVTYSRIAVTDVGTFLPVMLALWSALRVLEGGRLRHYLIAGAATGLACGFKYTAGLVILPLLMAVAIRVWRERESFGGRGALGRLVRRRELRYTLAGLAALVAVFAITTPFFFVHLHIALYQLKTQAQTAGGSQKLGQAQQGGLSYYVHSLGWGFGWAAAALALVGAALEIRRDRVRAAVLLVFPVVLFLYMSTQTRYFGRWLLAMYPILAVLCGVAVVRIAELVPRRRLVQAALVVLVTGAVLIQPIASDIRTTQVLARTDTRQLARDYLVRHYPRDLRAVVEPAVPDSFYLLAGVRSRDRARQFVRGFTLDVRRGAAIDTPLGADTTYAATLRPGDIDAYRRAGYCTIVTMSLIRGRVENNGNAKQRAYYRRLLREARLVRSFSPFKPGRKPVPLHFDFSYNYYPTAYLRPGPIVGIYRLSACTQKYGRVATKPFGTSGLDKGLKSSYVPGA